MKKEKIEILRYNKVDENLDELIRLTKLISKYNGVNLQQHLIFFDSNYPSYLRKVIENSDLDYLYILMINDNLEGFIHFKIINDTLFFNNFCMSENYQGKGLGKMFLVKCLNLMNIDNFKYLAKDVFMSNQPAFLWYIKIGLEVTQNSNWNKIVLVKNQKNYKLPEEMIFKKDLNGFNSLFFKNNKIATLINDSTMILHDLTHIKQMPLKNYIIITNQNTEFLEKENFEIIELETSARMICPIKKLYNNLIN
jgi:ribosomal protein S18 acetylase RimI-like enzyme